ncbi:MAG: YtxH domain-containing protein [Thermomicrobium sp.]|nr:YtxH domain-containing protein [Thermomicrobium sp.]MDW8059514.1 YtxH domain-containing protein [Thermomicrobium sp.]
MLGRLRTAAKFFTWGLLIGLLFAPASGQELRHRLVHWCTSRLQVGLERTRARLTGSPR